MEMEVNMVAAEGRKIDKRQIRKIHALKNAIKLSEDKYRQLIYINFYPATSSKELTFDQANFFIKNLEDMAKETGVWKERKGCQTYEDLGYREKMASPKQLRMIEAIWKEISTVQSSKGREKALRDWLDNYFKVSDLRFLDRAITQKVIYTLKQMQTRKSGEEPQNDSKPSCNKMRYGG
jgi:hypothetical protein